MSQRTWVFLLELGVFLSVVFYLGYLGWRRSKGVAGFFVADRFPSLSRPEGRQVAP